MFHYLHGMVPGDDVQASGQNHLMAEDPGKKKKKKNFLPFIAPGGQEEGQGFAGSEKVLSQSGENFFVRFQLLWSLKGGPWARNADSI